MTKQQVTIEVDVPEGKLVEHKRCFAKGLCEASVFAGWHRFEVLLWLKDDWQWPESLSSGWAWLSMNADGNWYFSRTEPYLGDDDVWHSLGGWADASAFTDFQPPPCTDWRTSKRRRPTQ